LLFILFWGCSLGFQFFYASIERRIVELERLDLRQRGITFVRYLGAAEITPEDRISALELLGNSCTGGAARCAYSKRACATTTLGPLGNSCTSDANQQRAWKHVGLQDSLSIRHQNSTPKVTN
jgi:hypothetical protein